MSCWTGSLTHVRRRRGKVRLLTLNDVGVANEIAVRIDDVAVGVLAGSLLVAVGLVSTVTPRGADAVGLALCAELQRTAPAIDARNVAHVRGHERGHHQVVRRCGREAEAQARRRELTRLRIARLPRR